MTATLEQCLRYLDALNKEVEQGKTFEEKKKLLLKAIKSYVNFLKRQLI